MKEEIINSFNKDEYGKRMSNGRIEGTNGKIKAIKKISFGYDNFYHFRNRIIYIINDDEKSLSFPKIMTDKEAISYLKSKELSKEEIVDLNSWIRENNSFYSNPINAADDNGELLDYIEYLSKRNK